MTKKYQLKSYIKITQKEILDVIKIYNSTKELPFEYSGDNWIYDYEIEYQKRFGTHFDQFHTSPEIVEEFIDYICGYGDLYANVLDACSGLGQLALAIKKERKNARWSQPFGCLDSFDFSKKMVEIANFQGLNSETFDFTTDLEKEGKWIGKGNVGKYDVIVANPPFGRSNSLTKDFMLWAYEYLEYNGTLACILPLGIDKKEDKTWNQIWQKWHIVSIYQHENQFYNTNIKTATYIFEKLI
jgi:type I restriction-modification system DNA methylase subunit